MLVENSRKQYVLPPHVYKYGVKVKIPQIPTTREVTEEWLEEFGEQCVDPTKDEIVESFHSSFAFACFVDLCPWWYGQ